MSQHIAESVTLMHPDKICDQISDAILDACLLEDPHSRVAVETIGGHDLLVMIGEITTQAEVDFAAVARAYYGALTGQEIKVISHIVQQSPEIAQGVDTGGAGDQGIMVGYACRENPAFLPQEMYLARQLLKGFKVDGKSQVVLEGERVKSTVLSVQGQTQAKLKKHVQQLIKDDAEIGGWFDQDTQFYFNNTGAFDIGGFAADSGCTGRKIVVDGYGPRVPVGGGAFSGKDATKVDRSAAYMARWVALQLLEKYGAEEVLVKLGYVIGKAEPLIKIAWVDDKVVDFNYDCRPAAIIERFGLRRPIFVDTARYGHFGRIEENPWERS